jgi:aldose 1-epimerase
MYQHHIEKFGDFDRHIFSNSKHSFSLIPEYGAVLIDSIFDGVNVIEGFETPEALIDLKWGKSIVLYPFPNRMRDGEFLHEGKKYNFPIDNAATNNAIHGLGKKMPHPIVAITLAENHASVTCRNDYDGHLVYYPFPFRFEITFTLSDAVGMEIKMTLENTGEQSIPAGLGWHPYFSISEKIEDSTLQMLDLEQISIDERMLPTGEKTLYGDFLTAKKIASTSLDNGFFIKNQSENFDVYLSSEKGKLHYWQKTGENQCNFIQIFTPPHRTCIALEPMTCNIDAFNNNDGLVILKKGEILTADFGYNFA